MSSPSTKLSDAQFRVLADLLRGGDGWGGVYGRSMHGGMCKTLDNLRRRGFVTTAASGQLTITAEGTVAARAAGCKA